MSLAESLNAQGLSNRGRGPTKLNVNKIMKRASKMMVPVGYIILHMNSEISHDIMESLAHSVDVSSY